MDLNRKRQIEREREDSIINLGNMEAEISTCWTEKNLRKNI